MKKAVSYTLMILALVFLVVVATIAINFYSKARSSGKNCATLNGVCVPPEDCEFRATGYCEDKNSVCCMPSASGKGAS